MRIHESGGDPLRCSLGLCVAALVLSAVACGDGSRDGDVTTALRAFYVQWSRAVCTAFVTCSAKAPAVQTVDECALDFNRWMEDTDFVLNLRQIARGTVTFKPEFAEPCLGAIASSGCAVHTTLPAACEQVVLGTVPIDGPCTSTDECAPGAYCRTVEACPGRCAQRVPVGTTCEFNEDCLSGLLCDGGTCQAPVVLGMRCVQPDTLECQFGAGRCLGEPATCQSADLVFTQGEGAACDFIKGPLCLPGLECVFPVAGGLPSCVRQAQLGHACLFGDSCVEGSYCDAPDFRNAGRCQLERREGQSCSDAPCARGFDCEPGTSLCVVPQRIGSPCAGDASCYSGHCDNTGRCATPACAH